jgi:hypothetical protein
VAAAAFEDRDEAEAAAAAAAFEGEAAAAFEGEATAAAAAAAFEGEAAEAVAAAGGTAAAAAAGPIILAIESIAPALEDCFLPPAIFAYRLVTSSAQSDSKSSMCSLCCFSTNARNASRMVASTLLV